MVGWQRKQYERGSNGKTRRINKGERDWSRQDKELIKEYQDKYEKGNDERRKAG